MITGIAGGAGGGGVAVKVIALPSLTFPAASRAWMLTAYGPAATVGWGTITQRPTESAMVVSLREPPIWSTTVQRASAVPEKVTSAAFTTEPLQGVAITGTSGRTESTLKERVMEGLMFPTASVARTVMTWRPWASGLTVPRVHLPLESADVVGANP